MSVKEETKMCRCLSGNAQSGRWWTKRFYEGGMSDTLWLQEKSDGFSQYHSWNSWCSFLTLWIVPRNGYFVASITRDGDWRCFRTNSSSVQSLSIGTASSDLHYCFLYDHPYHQSEYLWFFTDPTEFHGRYRSNALWRSRNACLSLPFWASQS